MAGALPFLDKNRQIGPHTSAGPNGLSCSISRCARSAAALVSGAEYPLTWRVGQIRDGAIVVAPWRGTRCRGENRRRRRAAWSLSPLCNPRSHITVALRLESAGVGRELRGRHDTSAPPAARPLRQRIERVPTGTSGECSASDLPERPALPGPPRRGHVMPALHRDLGRPRPSCTEGALARRAAPWRSMFTRASASPGQITTASDDVAPVHRNLPPSMRSTVTVNLSAVASVCRNPAHFPAGPPAAAEASPGRASTQLH